MIIIEDINKNIDSILIAQNKVRDASHTSSGKLSASKLGDPLQEEWKDVPGYEGLYQVSSFGRVRSLDRTTTRTRKNGEQEIKYKGRILSPSTTNNFYAHVLVGEKTTRIHRLVAELFVPNKSKKKYVNHKDGNKHNNHFMNLEWVTRSENVKKAYRQGLMKQGKLTPKKVSEIRSSKETNKKLAKKFGVKPKTIRRARRGETWTI